VENVNGARQHQVATSETRNLPLSGGDRQSALRPHLGQPVKLVVPHDRLFKPANVQAAHAAAEFYSLADLPRLVGVAGDHEIFAHYFTRESRSISVVRRREAADLQLDPGQPDPLVMTQLFGELFLTLILHIITADGDDRDFVATPAQQLAHRLIERFADGVPERDVHGGDRLHQDTLVGEVYRMYAAIGKPEPARMKHLVPQRLDIKEVTADEQIAERGVDDPRDLFLVTLLVAAEDLSPHAPLAVDFRDERIAGIDSIGAALKDFFEATLQRNGAHVF